MYSAGWQSGRNKQGKFMLSHELGDYTICRDCITNVGASGTVLLAALGKSLLWLVYSHPRACTSTFLPSSRHTCDLPLIACTVGRETTDHRLDFCGDADGVHRQSVTVHAARYFQRRAQHALCHLQRGQSLKVFTRHNDVQMCGFIVTSHAGQMHCAQVLFGLHGLRKSMMRHRGNKSSR